MHEAGVDTIPELAVRNPKNLAQMMEEKNKTAKLVKSVPNEKQAKDWVSQAKKLAKIITY